MTYNFEVTNIDTMQIYRFNDEVKQKPQIPILGRLQRSALIYIFINRLAEGVSEISTKVNPEGDLVTMRIIGSNERFFVKIRADKCGEDGENNA